MSVCGFWSFVQKYHLVLTLGLVPLLPAAFVMVVLSNFLCFPKSNTIQFFMFAGPDAGWLCFIVILVALLPSNSFCRFCFPPKLDVETLKSCPTCRTPTPSGKFLVMFCFVVPQPAPRGLLVPEISPTCLFSNPGIFLMIGAGITYFL